MYRRKDRISEAHQAMKKTWNLGQMPGAGQISGLETGRGEKPACSTSAVQKEMSCDPGVEARGIYKAAGHPKTQYISGKGYVQKRQEQQNSDLKPGYKQKNGQDSCEETEISLMAEGGAKEFRQAEKDGRFGRACRFCFCAEAAGGCQYAR